MALYRVGLRSLLDMVLLVHIGRCGLVGSLRCRCGEDLGVPYETIRASFGRLEDYGLIVGTSNSHTRGRANRFVVSAKGWAVLVVPGDFSAFHAMEGVLDNGQSGRWHKRKAKTNPCTNCGWIGGNGGCDTCRGKSELCSQCGGCGMIPSDDPDGDVMNLRCPQCNPQIVSVKQAMK